MMGPGTHILEWFTAFAGKSAALDSLMRVLASDFFVPVSMSLFLLFLWFGTRPRGERERNQYGVICASLALGGASLVVKILNSVVALNPWPRPFLAANPVLRGDASHAANIVLYFPQDPSFPAKIAAVAFAAALGMFFYNRKASIPIFILAVLWSLARLYAGVHYPVDVLGGAAIGAVMACLSYGLMIVGAPFFRTGLRLAQRLYVA